MFAQYFQFHQVVAVQQFPGQFAGAYRILCGVTASRVGQDGIGAGGNHIQKVRLVRVLAQVGSAYRYGHNFGTAGFNGVAGFHQVVVLTGAYQ